MGSCRIVAALAAVVLGILAKQVALPAWQLYSAEVCRGEGGRYVLRAAASWYFGARWIEEGHEAHVVPDCLEGHRRTCELQAAAFSVLAVLGVVRVPAHCLAEAGVAPLGVLDKYEALRRTEAQPWIVGFCRSLLDYEHSPTPTIQATRQDTHDFVQACRDEYRKLKFDERLLLDPLHAGESIPEEFLRSWDVYTESTCANGTAGHEDHEPEPQLGEELAAAIDRGLEPVQQSAAARGVWRRLQLRGVPDVGLQVSKVGPLLSRGEVVRFKALRRFHPETWNVTPVDLVALEGAEAAARIPVVGQLPGGNARSLAAFAAAPGVGYVNAKRLPRFARRLPSLPSNLQMEDNVLLTQHTLLFGRVRWPHMPPIGETGCKASFQVNAEPNVYVQLRGEAKLLLIPQRFSDHLTACGRDALHLPCGGPEGLDALDGVPVVWAHLRAGDAIALPARTHHILSAQGDDSVALNSLFLPRWRHLEHTPHDHYSKAAKLALEHLALRQLWVRSLDRLHNLMGRVVYSNHGLLEWF